MKISKERLKQIIKEELTQASGEEAQGEQPNPDNEAKSTTALAKFFLGISKKVQSGEVKGLDPSEIQLFAALIEDVIGLISSSSASSQLKVLNKKVDQFKGSE
jgi:hypothetical protein